MENNPTPTDSDIFALLGLQALPSQQKMQLLQKIELAAREHIINLIIEQLNDQDCRELNDLIQNEAIEGDVLTFLQSRIPQLEILVQNRIDQFKHDLVQEVSSIRQQLSEMDEQNEDGPETDAEQSRQIKQELSQIEKDLTSTLKKGDLAAMTDLLQKSKKLKAKKDS